jgi:hypothetical protein
MGYFAREGDLPMMRWLYVNGADTRDVGVGCWFPMYAAADNARTEVGKWLFAHGAAKDIKRRTCELFSSPLGYPNGESPLSVAFGRRQESPFSRCFFSRWLILNGALCKDDDSGELDIEIMKQDLGPRVGHFSRDKQRRLLLEWANDLHQARSSFLLFLSGALSAPQHAYRTRRSSPLKILSGKAGVMELISDYTGGIVRGREAKIIRQLTEMLPKVDFRVSGESSSDE